MLYYAANYTGCQGDNSFVRRKRHVLVYFLLANRYADA